VEFWDRTGFFLTIVISLKIGLKSYMGRIRNVREDVKRVLTYKFVISRSTVQFCPLAPYNTICYSLGCSPFLSLGSIWGSIFDGLDALSPSVGRSYIGGVGAGVLFSSL